MQLPDAAAGKQGKCPKCSNAVTVPAPRAAAPLNPHDEEFWSGVGDKKKDAASVAVDPHKTEHRSDAQILKKIIGKAEAAKVVKRIGVPWERPREGGMFDRYWDTAIGVMNHTQDTFNEMRITGGIGSPFKFLILGAVLGSLIAAVYGLIGNAITVVSDSGVLEELEKEATAEAGEAAAGVVVTATMIVYIVLAFFGTFFGGIIGGIIHVFLQAVGLQLALPMVGVKQASFEKNFRVSAFTNGSIFLCNIVPGLGAGFMLFLWFKGMIQGIESVYEVPKNTAVMAVLLLFIPLVLPIVAVVGLLAMMMMGYIG
jgi:hypothetical protein